MIGLSDGRPELKWRALVSFEQFSLCLSLLVSLSLFVKSNLLCSLFTDLS
jgi:hypothetical protein